MSDDLYTELQRIGAIVGQAPSTLEVAQQVVQEFNEAGARGRKLRALIVVRLISSGLALATALEASGVSATLVTMSRANLGVVLQQLRTGALDAAIIPENLLHGWVIELDDVLLISAHSMCAERAMHFVQRVRPLDSNTFRRTLLLYLRQKPKPYTPPVVEPVHPAAQVEFKSTVTREQQDRLTWMLMELGFIERVTLGEMKAGAFVPQDVIDRDDAERVYRALHGDDE